MQDVLHLAVLSPSAIAETICPPDEICCGLDTNLKFQYEWKDSFNRTISTAKCINVNRTDTADNISAQSYRCLAHCEIRNRFCFVPGRKTVKIRCIKKTGVVSLSAVLA